MTTPPTTTDASDGGSPGRCWCCGVNDDPDRMVRLGDHPAVALCSPCARWAAQQARAIDDRDRTGVLVTARNRMRILRRGVVDRGWHRHRVIGRPLRWLGNLLP